jgi:hypothetical protein
LSGIALATESIGDPIRAPDDNRTVATIAIIARLAEGSGKEGGEDEKS